MTVRFWKYHGTGNDFVMLLDLEDRAPLSAALVAAVCDRRSGIGADGVIRVVAGGGPGMDFTMDYRNADGSLAEMCGNGIRCLAALLRHEGVTEASELRIATRAGERRLTIAGTRRAVERVTVDMGAPRLRRGDIPMTGPAEQPFRLEPVSIGDASCKGTAVSMGNPHLVLFVDGDPSDAPVTTAGPALESDPRFPEKTNVEFASVRDGRIAVRVWERGVGETMACGTGACAVFVAARDAGFIGDRATLAFPGGDLEVSMSEEGTVLLSGPAERVAEGTLDVGWLAARGLA